MDPFYFSCETSSCVEILEERKGCCWQQCYQHCLLNLQSALQMDKLALEQHKRCIMWDDEGAGFYLVGGTAVHNEHDTLWWRVACLLHKFALCSEHVRLHCADAELGLVEKLPCKNATGQSSRARVVKPSLQLSWHYQKQPDLSSVVHLLALPSQMALREH